MQIIKCLPFGNVTIPISFTAAVTPSVLVKEVPVLCATTVGSGSCPFILFFPVEVAIIVFIRKLLDVPVRSFLSLNAFNTEAAEFGDWIERQGDILEPFPFGDGCQVDRTGIDTARFDALFPSSFSSRRPMTVPSPS